MAGIGPRIFAGVRNSSGLLWLALIILAGCAVLSVDQVNDVVSAMLGGLTRNRMAAGAAIAVALGVAVCVVLRQQGNTAVIVGVVVAVGAAWLIYAKPANGAVSGSIDGVQWLAHQVRDFVTSLRSWDWHR